MNVSIMKPEFFYNFGIFIVKMMMRHGICLSGLLGTHLSLKRLVMFVEILFPILVHFMLRSYYVPLWCDMCNSSNHSITSCPYYACSAQPDFASPRDYTDVVLTLPNSSLPLA